MANALEQPLLLPQDMADLRTLRKREVFLTLKRDLTKLNFLLCHFFLLSIVVTLSKLLSFFGRRSKQRISPRS